MAQKVKPVLSSDYLLLIRNDTIRSVKNGSADSSNSMKLARLRFSQSHFSSQNPVNKIILDRDNSIRLKQAGNEFISITGTASASVEREHINRIPAVQNKYVQGLSYGNGLIWNGPETGKLYNYRPALQSLKLDRNSNAYDANGNLVKAGTGNGNTAAAFSNSMFRNVTLFTQAFTLNAKYKKITYT